MTEPVVLSTTPQEGWTLTVNNDVTEFPPHTFITLTDPYNNTYSYGFAPATPGSWTGTGIIHNDALHHADTSSSAIPLSDAQYSALASFINASVANPPDYNVWQGQECTNWAWEAMSVTFGLFGPGMSPPANEVQGYIQDFINTLAYNPYFGSAADAVTATDEALIRIWEKMGGAGQPHLNSEDMANIAQGMLDAMNAGSGVVVDPLVLDLSGNGINLTSMTSSHAYFDLAGEGFSHHTGWTPMGADMGILVQDAGNDGKITDISELFGNGAQSGFAELATLDTNEDGKITSADTDWSTLKVWIDENANGRVEDGELHTLGSLSITEIGLTTSESGTNVNGNTIVETANFVIDGHNHAIGEVLLAYDPTNTMFNGELETVNWDAMATPFLRGYGTIADTVIAETLDEDLLTMAQDLQSEASLAEFDDFVTDFGSFMFQWAGVQDVDPETRGAEYWSAVANAQELGFLEHFTGISFETPYGVSDPNFYNEWSHVHEVFNYAKQELAVKSLIQADPSLMQVARYDVVPTESC